MESSLDLPRMPGTGEFAFTPLGAALGFTAMYGGDIRYVTGAGWHAWGNGVWHPCDDSPLHVAAKDYADKMHVVVTAYSAVNEDGAPVYPEFKQHQKAAASWLRTLCTVSGIKAYLSLVATEPAICMTADRFDANPDLLNCINGTVNLRTGELMPHRREDYITQMCPVAYYPDATSSLWESVLERSLEDNKELISYVQRYHGYALTGYTTEQVFSFYVGPGGSGKSQIVEMAMEVMGSYACKAKTETILKGGRQSGACANPDIMALRGKRLVVLAETEQGSKMAEARMKDLTGGDRITARGLYERAQVTFSPKFKIIVYGNHKLEVTGTDEGIWRRINIVPFGSTIPAEERDKALPLKLRTPENQEGILAWMVKGAQAWYADGLMTPQPVTDATTSYRMESDLIQQWINERCIMAPNAVGAANILYQNYRQWLSEAGESMQAQRVFAQGLITHGVTKIRRTMGYVYQGLALKSIPTPMLAPASPAE